MRNKNLKRKKVIKVLKVIKAIKVIKVIKIKMMNNKKLNLIKFKKVIIFL